MLDDIPMTFSRGDLPPQMEKIAFALKQGAWAEVEDTPDRFFSSTRQPRASDSKKYLH